MDRIFLFPRGLSCFITNTSYLFLCLRVLRYFFCGSKLALEASCRFPTLTRM